MKKIVSYSAASVVLLAVSACSDGVHTLYRNSVLDQNMRVHVATFDANDGDKYNRENCEQAQQLFQAQSGVKTKFWCEKGTFKK